MPQMGESIFEGTITKWLKNPGDTVQQDEPLFEISTDKVDAEIPSPAAGVLAEIKVAGRHHRSDQHRSGRHRRLAAPAQLRRGSAQLPRPSPAPRRRRSADARAPRPSRSEVRSGGERRAFLAAGPPDRQGKQSGSAPGLRHRLGGQDHQGRHSRLSGQGRSAAARGAACAPARCAALRPQPKPAAPAASGGHARGRTGSA